MKSGDPLIGASIDKIGEIFNYETQFLDYFVDNFQSDNDKMKNVMNQSKWSMVVYYQAVLSLAEIFAVPSHAPQIYFLWKGRRFERRI